MTRAPAARPLEVLYSASLPLARTLHSSGDMTRPLRIVVAFAALVTFGVGGWIATATTALAGGPQLEGDWAGRIFALHSVKSWGLEASITLSVHDGVWRGSATADGAALWLAGTVKTHADAIVLEGEVVQAEPGVLGRSIQLSLVRYGRDELWAGTDTWFSERGIVPALVHLRRVAPLAPLGSQLPEDEEMAGPSRQHHDGGQPDERRVGDPGVQAIVPEPAEERR
jgi:hypothetical protein